MAKDAGVSVEEIRAAQKEWPNLRERDLAAKLGISEFALICAHLGDGITRIDAHPDKIIHAATGLGNVMALTRVEAAVHEKVGSYDNYHPGKHAAMVLTEDIDLRIFPSQWVHGLAVEKSTEAGPRRSLQVFDAAGDAIHKIFLREDSDLTTWGQITRDLAIEDQSSTPLLEPRRPTEAPKSDPAKRDILQKEWARMTDTHQFLRLCSKLKMNRLGAYRIAGDPFVRQLSPAAVDEMLHKVRDSGIEIMLFVGNRGCIQIHTGPVQALKPMGPWQNILDPGFNLHLRLDKIAEVWAVEKPTQRGPALSVEAFDAEGGLIMQVFGVGKKGRDSRPDWTRIVRNLAGLSQVAA